MKKRIALIGASMRCGGAFVPYLKTIADRMEIVGLLDIDLGKMKGFAAYYGVDCPQFTDFDQLCDTVHPDLVLVTTVDATHAHYVVRALDRKIGVISEKPLCINPEQCRAIWDAHLRNPEIFAATSHNARYSPLRRKMKEVVSSGILGRIRSINYAEMLDLQHGTSYFRRWNSQKKYSGGLQIHKASHHFDEIQWLLESRAQEVIAYGGLSTYGPQASTRRGGHCHSCKLDCPFREQYDEPTQKLIDQVFFKFGTPTSYSPDRCVFNDDIDIEDFISAGVRYRNGTYVNYNLIAHANFEGQHTAIEGENGRLEARVELYRHQKISGDIHDAAVGNKITLTLCRFGHGDPENIPLTLSKGTHGGSDNNIFKSLFAETPPDNLPTLWDGIQAVMVGAAINESLKTKGPVDVQQLLSR